MDLGGFNLQIQEKSQNFGSLGSLIFTEDVDNTENEPFESAHFNMEEQIYIRLKQFTTSFTFYLPK